jgi:hypothetical protein
MQRKPMPEGVHDRMDLGAAFVFALGATIAGPIAALRGGAPWRLSSTAAISSEALLSAKCSKTSEGRASVPQSVRWRFRTHHARGRGAATAPCLQTGCYGAESDKGRKRVQDQRSTGAEATSLNAWSFVPSGSTERGAHPRGPRRITLGDELSVEGAGRSPGATRAPVTRGSGWTLTAYATGQSG